MEHVSTCLRNESKLKYLDIGVKIITDLTNKTTLLKNIMIFYKFINIRI